MICNNCNTEWSDNNNNLNLKNCPFCGKRLPDNSGASDYSTMGDVLKYIVDRYGEEVLNDNHKVINLFKDLAPKLVKESQVFEVAMRMHAEKYFIGIKENERKNSIMRIKNDMIYLMSPEALDMVINAFSKALGWENTCSNENSVLSEKIINRPIQVKPSSETKMNNSSLIDFIKKISGDEHKEVDSCEKEIMTKENTSNILFGGVFNKRASLQFEIAKSFFMREQYNDAFKAFMLSSKLSAEASVTLNADDIPA